MTNPFKYFAFISYSSKDTAWGKRLQKKLEGYRMPATLCNERGWKRKPMDPVFFAPTDIQQAALRKRFRNVCGLRSILLSSVRPIQHNRNGWAEKLPISTVLAAPRTSISSLWKALRMAITKKHNASIPLSKNWACLKSLEPTSTSRYTVGLGSTRNALTCNSSPNCLAWSLMPFGNGIRD